MAITVKQALSIGGLQQGRLLAGAQQLDNVINHVNILEAPWEPFWETKDQLFLTSFYALQNNIPLQVETIKSLAENGCAALVFQTGVLNALDPQVIQQADQSGLPLIEVDETVDYTKIITPLVSAITREKTYLLQRSQEIHRRLTDLILGGDGLPAVVNALYDLIKRPAALVNTWGDIIASAAFENADRDRLPDLIQRLAPSSRPGSRWDKASGYWLTSLVSGGQDQADGFLLVRDPNQEAYPLDLTAMEQAATVASLELAKEKAVLETERRLKRDFLEDMLTGEYHSVEALLARSRSLGWDLANKPVVVLVDLNQFEAYYLRHLEHGEAYFQQIKRRFLDSVSRVVLAENPLSILVERSDSIIVMPHFAAEMPLTQAQRATHTLAEKICASVPESINDLSISVTIGNFYHSVEGLRYSYREASDALAVSARLANQPAIIWYEDVALYVLLMRFSDQAEVSRWLEQTLGRLIRYDENNETELVKTLEVYFDANQISQQAAHNLFIHPKTLKYRLRRIEEILGVDPFERDRQLGFYLATKLYQIKTQDHPSS